MDRSYLSAPPVVKAARKFVCIRLMAYESEEEAPLLAALFRTRSGKLENTVFAILSPDGKRALVRPGRSPRMAFRGAGEKSMAAQMDRIAKHYTPKRVAKNNAPLPYVKNLRLALNVAACDNLPLAISVGTAVEKQLKPVAWHAKYRGRLIHVAVKNTLELAAIDGVRKDAGLVLVVPDAYGLKGKLVAQVGARATTAQIEKAILRALAVHKPLAKDPRDHIREGRRQGVHWKTEIPVTDPGRPPPGRGPR